MVSLLHCLLVYAEHTALVTYSIKNISRYNVLVLWFCAGMSQFILCLLRGGKKISVAVVLHQLS